MYTNTIEAIEVGQVSDFLFKLWLMNLMKSGNLC